jgi:putative aldouronate transport system substrate-binding protein
MKKISRILALGLVASMGMSVLAACGGKDKPSGGSSTPESSVSGSQTDGNTGSSDDRLLVGLTTSAMVTDYRNNYFTKYLEEKLGFGLDFYMLPATPEETRTKVALMSTSKEDLPDVLITDNHLTTEMILQLGQSGFLMPLNDITADKEKMPNYNAIPEEDKAVMETAQTMADGNMYTLSSYEPETWNMTPYRYFINKTWLDKLGLDVPTTTDELKDVLIAFRDNDPNGNNKKDEIGVYGFSGGGYGQNISAALMNSFVFWNGGAVNGGLDLAEDGKTVIAPFTSEEWRDGLRYMADLYKEGVLAGAMFTDDDNQFKATVNQDPPIVGLVTSGSLSTWPDVKNNKNFAEMKFIEPFVGPKGVQYTPYNVYNPGQEFSIINGTKKLDMAIQFGDVFFDHDVSLIERFGEEGVDWTRDPKDLEGQENAFTHEGIYDKLTMMVTSTFWADNQSQTWRNHGPRYASLEMGNTVFDFSTGNKFDPEDPTQLNAKCYQLYFDKHPENVLPALHYSLEDAEKIQEQLTNIPQFVKGSLAEFVTGTRDVEKGWDQYLSELENMGLNQWIEVAQKTYDSSK